MDNKIIKKFEQVRDFEMDNFKKVGYCDFTVLMLDETKDGKLIAGMFQTLGSKDEFMKNRFDILYRTGRMISKDNRLNIVALISVSEAWVSHVKKDKEKDYNKDIGLPSKDPNKIEVMLFNVMDKDENTIMFVHEIKDRNGKRYIEPKPMQSAYDKVENMLLGSFWKGFKGYIKIPR